MPVRINVGLTKKVGQENFGSLGSSCHVEFELDGGYDAILHPDVEFWSPIVFTPQKGRVITKMYLTAAGGTIGGGNKSPEERAAEDAEGKGFRYVREVLQGHDALLEFETTMAGKYVNGIDLIRCDDDGWIVDFKVMIRPLQAVNLVHEQMMGMLEKLQG